jgi:phospholipase/lecithinase/hemolysin
MSIRSLARLTAVLVFAAFGSVAAHAYDAIIVFGDSYNDVGNLTALAAKYGFVYPPAPYYPGHFSNGPIWIEDVASDWKLPMLPSSTAGGTDYAFAGADLLVESTTGGLPTPSVLDEVGEYLAAHGGKADPKALYVIEGGGNDILDSTDLDARKLACEIARGLHGIEVMLRKAGAKSFLIPELIDVGQLPAAGLGGKEFVKFASETSIYANEELERELAEDTLRPGIEIYRLHVFRTFQAVANSETHFGFTDVTDPCVILSGLTLVSECADPVHNLWWDAEHPTTFGHAFFAVLTEGRLANH